MTALVSAIAAGGAGVYAGVKLRGLVPLRSPNNSVRIANAETDARIAELAVEQRRHEFEREHVEAEGRHRLDEMAAAREVKQLQTAAAAAKVEGSLRAQRVADAVEKRLGVAADDDQVEEAFRRLDESVAAAERRSEAAADLARAVRSMSRPPNAVRDALREYDQTR